MNAPPGSRIESLEPASWAVWRRRLRKLAIIAFFMLVLVPVAILNCGVNLEKAGFPTPAAKLEAMPALNSLLLRQQWTLFTYISPFNYTTHFEVLLKDGSTVPLPDSVPQHATGWKPASSKPANHRYRYRTLALPTARVLAGRQDDSEFRIVRVEGGSHDELSGRQRFGDLCDSLHDSKRRPRERPPAKSALQSPSTT